MTIYKSAAGKEAVLKLYDSQLARLGVPCLERDVDTDFGRTHLIETGNLQGIPLLVFHGGNATSPCNLLSCGFLMETFHLYAADTIGHPGKSAEVSLSARNSDYGVWAGQVISALGYESIRCMGGSFGAGILAKAMCAAPEKIRRAVLYVPAGIRNAPSVHYGSMLFPMMLYWITKEERWLKKCLLPMALTEDAVPEEIYETARLSIKHAKIKAGMPGNVSRRDMQRCRAPALVMAAERDCLFPARRVLPRAQKILPNCTAYLLEGRGHINRLTGAEQQMIVDFLKQA